jgi:hypothetical protein
MRVKHEETCADMRGETGNNNNNNNNKNLMGFRFGDVDDYII